MKRFRWDKKYLYWGVTAFLVIAAAILFYMIVNHLSWLGKALHHFGKIISPFIWGLVIAYILYPLMRIYQKGLFAPLWKFLLKKSKKAEQLVPKLARGFSVFLAIISLLVILTGLIWMVAPQMYTSIETIIVNSGDYIDQADAWISRFFMNYPEIESTLSGMFGDVSKGLVNWATNNLLPEFKGLLTNVTSGVFSFAKGIYNIIIGIIVSIYVLYSRETFGAHCKKILYAVFSMEAARKILDALHALIFVIFIIVLQQLDGNVLGPKILGNHVGINGFWVLFSILVGAGLFSFGGMLLGVPVFVVIYTFFRNLTNRKLARSGLPVETEKYVSLDHFDPNTGEAVDITEEKRTARRKREKIRKKKKGTAMDAAPSNDEAKPDPGTDETESENTPDDQR